MILPLPLPLPSATTGASQPSSPGTLPLPSVKTDGYSSVSPKANTRPLRLPLPPMDRNSSLWIDALFHEHKRRGGGWIDPKDIDAMIRSGWRPPLPLPRKVLPLPLPLPLPGVPK